jgi:wyosine [tRNA(Phe)-imidazoG37] synthetase (radical SAM superfamily)
LKLSAEDKPKQPSRYIYGPVPSRRLGRSLGVDIIPFKICPLDCVYCQLGRTTDKVAVRKEYVPIDDVVDELRNYLEAGVEADFITISGSGEPTLHSCLGELINRIKTLTQIPVAVLTNSVLFDDPAVRSDCVAADVVLPSLDAADQQTFEKINRPCTHINIENVISGLCEFRNQFTGQIWLEVFIVEGFNTGLAELAALRAAISRIRPDKVQLNTAVRPTAEALLPRVTPEKLRQIAAALADNAEIVADFAAHHQDKRAVRIAQDVLSLLRRRPCSLEDICNGLGLSRNEAIKHIEILRSSGLIETVETAGVVFFKPTRVSR